MNTENTEKADPQKELAGCVIGRRAFVSRYLSVFICGSLLLLSIGGCASAVSNGESTSLGGDDLQRITDDMAMKLAAAPSVREEIAKTGPLAVVVEPVENRMTGEILPRGQAMAFTGRVRNLLAKSGSKDFIWIVNRDEFYALRGQERGEFGPSPDAIQPRYALHARFQTVTKDSQDSRSVYYLCVYELTDITNRLVLWTGSYEMKKAVVKGFLD
jgi:hypothetical protein